MKPRVAPLEVRLRPSWRLAALLAALHVLGVAAVLVSGLPAPIRALLVAALGAALADALWRHVGRRHAGAVVALRVGEGGAVTVELRSGQLIEGRLSRDTLVHPALVALRLVTLDGRRTVLVPPDALDPATFRRLRVRLRWMRPAPGGETPPGEAAL